MYKTVSIGQILISNDQKESLRMYVFASCIGLTMYCPINKVLGMAHIALPFSSSIGGEKDDQPAYYAVLAVPRLIQKMSSEYGCCQDELIVKVFGGTHSAKETDFFQIGKRNIHAIKKILSVHQLHCDTTETGGPNNRTLEMDVATGRVKLDFHPLLV